MNRGLHTRMTRYGSWSVFDGRRKLSGGWISEQDAIDELTREQQRRAGTYKREPLVLRDFQAEFRADESNENVPSS